MFSSNKISSGKTRKADAKKEVLQQQDVLQAVLIADNFSEGFMPISLERPSALFPLVNEVLLDYSLKALKKCGIQETFIFCSNHSQKIRDHVNTFWSSENSPMAVTVISSDSFMSLGDAMRELDSKALIRSDFILINGCGVCTLPLSKVLNEHRKCRKDDKGCALTLIYRKAFPQSKTRCKEHDVLIAIESSTKKIRFYQKTGDKKSLHIPLGVFQENSKVQIHYDLLDCHASICSPCVPPLYSDNFDYQTFDDFIRGLIINEEILGNSMYVYISSTGYGAAVTNFSMYDAVSRDIVKRWSYPVVPDLCSVNGSRFYHHRHDIYKELTVDLNRTCILERNVVVGKGTSIGENTYIKDTVIGQNCRIGANITISGSYLWDNVVVGDNSTLEKCLLADYVVLKQDVRIASGCILSNKVVVDDYVSLPPQIKLQFEPSKAVYDFGDSNEDDTQEDLAKIPESLPACDPKFVGVNGRGYLFPNPYNSDEEGGSSDFEVKDKWGLLSYQMPLESDDDGELGSNVTSSRTSHVAVENSEEDEDENEAADEDAIMFYNEVLDSLQRGIDEKIKSENLILEINSSKYAYNVTMKEVNVLVIRAILKITHKEEKSAQEYFSRLKPTLLYLMPVISNYIKNTASQNDCLHSIEEFMINNEHLTPAFMKILHILYEKEVLNENVILKWHSGLSFSAEAIRIQIAPFVRWLQEADEESSDD